MTGFWKHCALRIAVSSLDNGECQSRSIRPLVESNLYAESIETSKTWGIGVEPQPPTYQANIWAAAPIIYSNSCQSRPALQKSYFVWIFPWNLPGNFALKSAGDFWWFFWSPFPTKRSTKSPQKVWEANFGKKIRKIRNFCSATFLT